MSDYLENDPVQEESPNPSIDLALAKLMKNLKDAPIDMAVKVINSAIAWEKVKHAITAKDDDFDPDAL